MSFLLQKAQKQQILKAVVVLLCLSFKVFQFGACSHFLGISGYYTLIQPRNQNLNPKPMINSEQNPLQYTTSTKHQLCQQIVSNYWKNFVTATSVSYVSKIVQKQKKFHLHLAFKHFIARIFVYYFIVISIILVDVFHDVTKKNTFSHIYTLVPIQLVSL